MAKKDGVEKRRDSLPAGGKRERTKSHSSWEGGANDDAAGHSGKGDGGPIAIGSWIGVGTITVPCLRSNLVSLVCTVGG